MIYGYARVSTAGQAATGNGLEEQRKKLTEAGCTEIIEEHFTTNAVKPLASARPLKKSPCHTIN